MAKSDVLPQIEFASVLREDVEEILQAQRRSKIAIQSKDIRSAGNEVEIAVRKLLDRKLPKHYRVGHGHVVDSNWNVSTQFDVIIADSTHNPVLFQAEDGTEYFPYEAVYAVGEVKSTYYSSKKPLSGAIHAITRLRKQLKREPTPATYFGGLNYVGPNLNLTGIDMLYRNPLFSFVLFVDANDLKEQDITNVYRGASPADMPNVVCFLNQGILGAYVMKGTREDPSISHLQLYPEFPCPPEVVPYWNLVRHGDPRNANADLVNTTSFGMLYGMLMEHFQKVELMPIPLINYLQNTLMGHSVRCLCPVSQNPTPSA